MLVDVIFTRSAILGDDDDGEHEDDGDHDDGGDDNDPNKVVSGTQ